VKADLHKLLADHMVFVQHHLVQLDRQLSVVVGVHLVAGGVPCINVRRMVIAFNSLPDCIADKVATLAA